MGFGDRRVLKVADKLSKGGRYFTEQQLACACLLKKERSPEIVGSIGCGCLVFLVCFVALGMLQLFSGAHFGQKTRIFRGLFWSKNQ